MTVHPISLLSSFPEPISIHVPILGLGIDGQESIEFTNWTVDHPGLWDGFSQWHDPICLSGHLLSPQDWDYDSGPLLSLCRGHHLWASHPSFWPGLLQCLVNGSPRILSCSPTVIANKAARPIFSEEFSIPTSSLGWLSGFPYHLK